MDRWLEKDLEIFSKLMTDKGYTSDFLVNGKYSGDLLSAMTTTAEAAHAEEYSMFPVILHTRVPDPNPSNLALLKLRVDHGDNGLRIRDAEIESLKIEGKTRYNVNVNFLNTMKFPSNEELLDKMKKKISKQIKPRR